MNKKTEYCAICGYPISSGEQICSDSNGDFAHTDCVIEQILEESFDAEEIYTDRNDVEGINQYLS